MLVDSDFSDMKTELMRLRKLVADIQFWATGARVLTPDTVEPTMDISYGGAAVDVLDMIEQSFE